MTTKTSTSVHKPKSFIPEVIQTSAMDCGPAALKALLAGFGIHINYSRLREACQTDLDGASIDVLEDVAAQLGLSVGQFIVPRDHLLMPETKMLPGIVVTASNGSPHFVVAWRLHDRFVQVMDPSTGRAFKTHPGFLRNVYLHRLPVSVQFARGWLNAPSFIVPLRRRLTDLGFSRSAVDDLLKPAQSLRDWLPLAAIDAATRLVTGLVQSKAIKIGPSAVNVVERIAAEATRRGAEQAVAVIPKQYWSASMLPSGDVELLGSVIVHAKGRTGASERATKESNDEPERRVRQSPELAAAVGAEGPSPVRSILNAMVAEHRKSLYAVPVALLLAGAATGLEGLLMSRITSLSDEGTPAEASRILLAVSSFLLITLLLNLSLSAVLSHIGRWLDIHLRVRLLDKLPRLGNYYFNSRLKSDLAQRAHALRSLRELPRLAGSALRITSEILLTAIGLIWLVPSSTLPILLAVAAIVGLPIVMFPLLREQEVRRTAYTGVLTRFHLDALLGHTPIRSHRAEHTVRTEHESRLAQWAGATREFYWTHISGTIIGTLAGTFFAIWAMNELGGEKQQRAELALVVLYWALKLPALAQQLVTVVLQQLPSQQNNLGNLFDVLTGPEETEAHAHRTGTSSPRHEVPQQPGSKLGTQLLMREVSVVAAGQQILSNVDLEIQPGEHVAIVGPSGSGKTSLVGLLLGWHRASSGSILVDGKPADIEQIQKLRRETAWVDPTVQIWNRSFDENLAYGTGDVSPAQLRSVVEHADLAGVLSRLPERGRTTLGEGGALVSGGEGQRIRLARAMLRRNVRLVILDEPFRGLDHDQRCALLAEARRHWGQTTLLYVSHDIDTALGFDRVLVIENGRLVEDGAPTALVERPDSRFSALKKAHDELHREIWHHPIWRRWRMERGTLHALENAGPTDGGQDAA